MGTKYESSFDEVTYYTDSGIYAPIDSPVFIGNPSLPSGTVGITQIINDNSTRIATTAYIDSQKNQPNGLASLDASGNLVGVFIPRLGTAAEIGAIVLEQGELAVCTDTKQLKIGDGSSAGGYTAGGLQGQSIITLSSISDSLLNGSSLRSAYALAKTMTPYSGSLSDTNRMVIQLADGIYDMQSTGLTIDNSYVDILGQSTNTIIKGNDTGNVRGVLYHKSVETPFEVSGGYLTTYTSGTTLAALRIGSAMYADWLNCIGYGVKISGASPTGYNGTYDILSVNSAGGGTAIFNIAETGISPATGVLITAQLMRNTSKLENLTLWHTNTTYTISTTMDSTNDPAAYFPDLGLGGQTLRNVVCTGDDVHVWSMRNGRGVIFNGRFDNVIGGKCAFAGGYRYGGKLTGGLLSYCKGGDGSFAGEVYGSFDGNGPIGGCIYNTTGIDCVAGYYSFAGGGYNGGVISGGLLANCKAGNGSFAAGAAQQGGTIIGGMMINCLAGQYSFAAGNTMPGVISGNPIINGCMTSGTSFAGCNFSGGTIVGGKLLNNHAKGSNNFRVATFSGAVLSNNTVDGALIDLNNSSNIRSVYASGTPYTITATGTLATFGSTSPTLSLTTSIGAKFKLRARANVQMVGATFDANRTVTVKLRKTTGTAADILNATTSILTDVTTAKSGLLASVNIPEVIITAAETPTTVQLWALVDVIPTTGSIVINEASIIAEPCL